MYLSEIKKAITSIFASCSSSLSRWVFLIELPDRGYHGFLLPASRIVPTAESAMAGLRAAAAEIANGIA